MPKTAKKKKYKSAEQIRKALKLKSYEAKNEFSKKYEHASKKLKDSGLELGKIREHSGKLITAGALAGTLAVSSHGADPSKKLLPPPHEIMAKVDENQTLPSKTPAIRLREGLAEILPEETRPLTQTEEKYLEKIIQETTGIPAKATLEGEHLNTTYGKIGAEQHLRRYPGDVNENHAPDSNEYGGDRPQEILKEGMAPGLGAWGYFANSKAELTPELEETERWYSVAQTLYLHDWNTRQPYLKNWYKHRKFVIINTDNGKAVVTALADSGPAAFTGKHFGGSPEVMDYLGGPRYKKGPVIMFFVDDPENKVPLGPVEYNNI